MDELALHKCVEVVLLGIISAHLNLISTYLSQLQAEGLNTYNPFNRVFPYISLVVHLYLLRTKGEGEKTDAGAFLLEHKALIVPLLTNSLLLQKWIVRLGGKVSAGGRHSTM